MKDKMNFTIESKILGNAFLEVYDHMDFFEWTVIQNLEIHLKAYPNHKIASLVCLVTIKYENGKTKNVFTCNSGGSLLQAGENPKVEYTPVGSLTTYNASKFVSPNNKTIINEIICLCSATRLKDKIYAALNSADEGDLVIFLGDIANECDGKITPLLNVNGMTEAPKFRGKL